MKDTSPTPKASSLKSLLCSMSSSWPGWRLDPPSARSVINHSCRLVSVLTWCDTKCHHDVIGMSTVITKAVLTSLLSSTSASLESTG